jgi:hypothetical protein
LRKANAERWLRENGYDMDGERIEQKPKEVRHCVYKNNEDGYLCARGRSLSLWTAHKDFGGFVFILTDGREIVRGDTTILYRADEPNGEHGYRLNVERTEFFCVPVRPSFVIQIVEGEG